MKGINVRKIAAFAGAAVLGLSAIAVADVYYGNTQLVDQNGQPTVKVYVGSKAMVSDGVAAANIAAKIANEAYKSSVLTAQVSGTPTCSVTAGAGTSGTCSVVESSKKVVLEVTVPGQVAGTHTFKTLITDTVDKTLQNRNNSRSEDFFVNSKSSTDTGNTAMSEPSPLRGTSSTYGSNSNGDSLYRIGSDRFNNFADVPMTDAQANGFSYTEQQAFWVGTSENAVKYDTQSDIRDVDVYGGYSVLAYSAKFLGNDYGIPVCTGDLNSNTSDDWTTCATDSNSRTDRHRLKLDFLGGEWIISEMNDPALTVASSTNVTNGGQIKLAKEAKYGIINVGQQLDAGVFKVRLSDISVATGSTNTHPAIIDILDANDQVVGQVQVDPGTTYTFSQGGTANLVKIHVYKTAPGFTLNAKWAEMAIYTDEIVLKDGAKYNQVSTSDPDKYFKASLLWKNRDYTGSSGGNDGSADSLREIVIYNTDDYSTTRKVGDVANFMKSAPVYKLTYKGVDLSDSDYQQLSISAESPRSATWVADAADSTNPSCGASRSDDWTYTSGKWIRIRTNGNSYLGGSSANLISNSQTVEEVYYDPVGLVTPGAAVTINGLSGGNLSTGIANSLTDANSITYYAISNATAITFVGNTSAVGYSAAANGQLNVYVAGANQTGINATIPAADIVAYNSLSGTAATALSTIPAQRLWTPKIFYKPSNSDCYRWNQVSAQTNPVSVTEGATTTVLFEKVGENTQAHGGIFFGNGTAVLTTGGSTTGATLGANFQGTISIKEDAGYYGTNSNNLEYIVVPFIANGTSSTDGTNAFRFKTSDATNQNTYYYGLAGTWTNNDPVLVTERGSKVTSVGNNDVKIMVATRVGMPTFEFALADSTAAVNANEYTLGVGDTQVFGGVTVKVKSIDANAGSCSVVGPGGKPACSVDSTSLAAVISPDNKGSVEVSQPFPLSSKLVGLDSEGTGTGVAILVGGPMVNTMTADTLKDTTVNLQTDGPVVREFGSKIVVAGYTAADTMAAADTFIAGITRK